MNIDLTQIKNFEFKVILILIMGSVNLCTSLIPFNSKYLSSLKSFSVAPVVFSYRVNLGRVHDRYTFDIYLNKDHFVSRRFNREYYKNLKGPHRYKIFHFMALRRKSMITHKPNSGFYKDVFCGYNDIKDGFKINFEIYRVVIRSKSRIFHDFKCKS